MRLPIQHKISIIIIILATFILSGIFFYLNTYLYDASYHRLLQNLKREVLLVSVYLYQKNKSATNQMRYDQLADEIGRLMGYRLTVINKQGEILGDSTIPLDNIAQQENLLFQQEIQAAIKKGMGTARRYNSKLKDDIIYVAYTEIDKPDYPVFRLAASLVEIDTLNRELSNAFLFSLLMIFLFALLIGVIVRRMVSQPINNITAMVRHITAGDHSHWINHTSMDEIEELGRAVNYMSEQIKGRIDEIISNKSRFEAILLSMLEGVMVIDKHGKIILLNNALKKLLRIEIDPVNKKPLEVVRNIEIQDIAEKVLALRKNTEVKELTILPPVSKTLNVHAAPVFRSDQVDGAVLVFHDMTELRSLENIRRDFVANVSHELRTPITNIKGFSETLLEGAINDKENAYDFIKIICSDANRLAQLVEDLLDLSKIESGKVTMNLEPIKIREVVNRIVRGLKEQAKRHKVVLKVDMPDNLPEVNADEGGIAQVFLNLIDNSIKYNKEDGEIIISAVEEMDYVCIQVRDTGIGIPEKDIPRIFERFYRVDKARSRALGGTGLGLSIAKHIIQAHGGDISVVSTLQVGTTFSFTLKKA